MRCGAHCRLSRLADGWTGLLARQQESRTAKVRLERVSLTSRGGRARFDTPAPSVLLPAAPFVPDPGRKGTELRWAGLEDGLRASALAVFWLRERPPAVVVVSKSVRPPVLRSPLSPKSVAGGPSPRR